MTQEQTLLACKAGIAAWQTAFNNQDAAACAAQYEEGTVMHARPFGTFTGREEIQTFWQGIIDQGFSYVDYTEVEWTAMNDDSYVLTAKWTMNKAFGVVHHEQWRIQADGSALLAADDFEVQGER
ncbi:nuclear transport factor 2 family protein [Moritella sp. Urea-trap-13]|uniref:YybH family protein n=1 Tax=Moritella sp. Urea-trap-13 TaxID=2058327 RepID=UPI000C32C6F7|nr:nuclear transport factor 2 family protein [Moritella sp. Urea-trap-13]PKH08148.1 isochorismatase [Moritella sp. Urea-trap-13]